MGSRTQQWDRRLRAIGLACAVAAAPCAVRADPPTPVIEHGSQAFIEFAAARDGGDAIAIVAAARRLEVSARAVAGPIAAEQRMIAAEALAAHGAESEALAIVADLTTGPPFPGNSAAAFEWRSIRQRALVVGAHALEQTGHPDAALDDARRALEIEESWVRRESVREALRIVVRLAYRHGLPDEARTATQRLVRESSRADLSAAMQLTIDAVLDAHDDDGMSPLLEAVVQRIDRHSPYEMQFAVARLRMRIARTMAQRGDATGAAREINAIRAAEVSTRSSLYDLAARDSATGDIEAYEVMLGAIEQASECDSASSGLSRASFETLRSRLATLDAIRTRMEWYRVPAITASARLREAAIHEAAASTVDGAVARCAADGANSTRTRTGAQATQLEVAANRLETRDPGRAATLRVEALVLRERAERSGATSGGTSIEWRDFVAAERQRSVDAVGVALTLWPDARARWERTGDPARLDASPAMSRWVRRALAP